MFELRLKNEFKLLQQLQSEMPGTLRIQYRERYGDEAWKSVMQNPVLPVFPIKFRVTYMFPCMYVGFNCLQYNWRGTILFSLSEEILMKPDSNMGVSIENESFPTGYTPFNHHIAPTYVCVGSAWKISRNMGVWYFVIMVGCLFNMDKTILDPYKSHLNNDAFLFWKNVRNMQPTNGIRWPFDLLNRQTTGAKQPSSGMVIGRPYKV